MRAAEPNLNSPLTIWSSIMELGWFSVLFGTVVGAPSCLSIIQMIIQDYKLTHAFQWIVNGYDSLVAVMAGLVEPIINPVLSWINARLGLQLEMHPHWRPLLLLSLIIVTAFARSVWRIGDRLRALEAVSKLGIFAFLGAVAAGVVPPIGSWKHQGAIAAVPVFSLMLAMGMWVAGNSPPSDEKNLKNVVVGEILAPATYAGMATFAIAAALSFAPMARTGAGFIALAGFIVGVGFFVMKKGLKESDVIHVRQGLTVLGGFGAAAMILIADTAIRLLGN